MGSQEQRLWKKSPKLQKMIIVNLLESLASQPSAPPTLLLPTVVLSIPESGFAGFGQNRWLALVVELLLDKSAQRLEL